MKLEPLQQLMLKLAMGTNDSQFRKLLSLADLSEWQRGNLKSPVELFVTLLKKAATNSHFLAGLERLLADVDQFHHLAKIVQEFRREYSDADALTSTFSPALPHGAGLYSPPKEQKLAFKKVLMNISSQLQRHHLEIMVALSPVPDGRKDRLSEGYRLFNALHTHGCISENDTELLDDFFTRMNLLRPLESLNKYKSTFHPVHFEDRKSVV